MKYKSVKIVVLFMVAILTVTLFAGCSGNKNVQSSSEQSAAKQSSANNSQQSQEPEPLTLPIVKEPLKLTLFSPLDSKAAPVVKSHEDIGSFKELEKRTGIDIEWQHPPIGQEKEQFNLMLASQELPDMIYYSWRDIPGGPQKAIQDGAIIKLNDWISKYAPNITKIFNEYPEVRKQAVTDDGTLYMLSRIREPVLHKETAWYVTSLGPQMRKDWLDKLSLKAPTTINEWHDVLLAFKQKDPNGNGKADELPFVSNKDSGLRYLAAAWGVLYDFYMDNGTIKYGPIEPAFKDFVNTLRTWYAEGLIDPDFASSDNKNFEAKITSNVGGSYIGSTGGNFTYFTKLMQDKDPNFKLIALPWPIGPTGKSYTAQVGIKEAVTGTGIAISSKNQHVKESIKWIDYGYSEDGIVLLNWGVEGESYKIENGKKVFTDYLLNNPEGLDVDTAMAKFAIGGISGWATVQESERAFYKSGVVAPWELDVLKTFGQASPDLTLPPITPNADESTRMAAIMNEINTYRDEMFVKFIMGQEPMENFDKFVQTIKGMGIDEALKIENAALDRYNKRK